MDTFSSRVVLGNLIRLARWIERDVISGRESGSQRVETLTSSTIYEGILDFFS